jgi:signal transduction histidine kinase
VSVEGERAHAGRVLDADTEHTVKNHLAVILGFCELLLAETPADDARHGDLEEIHHAARELTAIFKRELPR